MFNTIFKKVYTVNLVDDEGLYCGALVLRVWFFVSAFEAYALIGTGAKKGQYFHNFRRVP